MRGSDWPTLLLIMVNFNHFFIQPAPGNVLTRNDRKAASDWLLLNDQILAMIYDNVTFNEINNKIECKEIRTN